METVPVLASARRLFLYRERAEAFYGECLRTLLTSARTGLLLLVIVCTACSVNPYSDETGKREPGASTTGEDARGPGASLPRDSGASPGRQGGSASAVERDVLTRVAKFAQEQIGVPYRFGGHTPKGFDCSGLVFYSYARAGVTVPRTSDEQLRASRELQLVEAVPGDLVFFSSPDKISHVGIYLGDGQFVHAPSTGKSVVINDLEHDYYRRHLVGIGRLDVEQQANAPAATPLR